MTFTAVRPFLCGGWGFKWGRRAASPLAAVAVCSGGKACGRDESLPYELNRKRDIPSGCGPGMPGPYRAAMGKQDVAASWRAAYMRPLQIGGSLQRRGFGALGGAQRAPPASKAGPLVRLLAPQGQALLTTPVSLRSTVAPCSQPRTPSQQRDFSLLLSFGHKRK